MITDRIDAITDIFPTLKSLQWPPPRSVKIELTGKCNLNCGFCAKSQNLRDLQEMDTVLYKRLVVDFIQSGVEELGLFYLGESFMAPWLSDAVRYAKNLGMPYVFLTTNGALAKPRKVEDVIRAGLDSLKFSLNYADEKQFAEITGAPEALFQIVINNIKTTKEIRDWIERETGHRCGLYASYIKYDGAQAERMESLIEELNPYLDEIYILPLYSQADLTGQDEAERGWEVTAGNRGRIGALRPPVPCWAVFTEGHVTWDGKLSACCFDHDGRFEMGDLNEQTFMEAWNSEKLRDLRATHLLGRIKGSVCEGCVAYG